MIYVNFAAKTPTKVAKMRLLIGIMLFSTADCLIVQTAQVKGLRRG